MCVLNDFLMIHIEHFTFNSFQTRCSVVWDDSGVCAFVDPGCASAAELSRLTAFTASRGLRPAAIMLTHAHFDHIYGVDALVREYGIPVYMHPDEAYTLRNTNPYVCRMYGLPEPETAFADGLLSGSAGGAASEMGCGPTSEPGCGPGDETASGPACGSVSEKACGPGAGLVTVVEGDVIKVGTLRFEVIETPGHTAGGICLFEREDGVLFTGDTLFAGAIGRTDHPGGDYDQLMKSILQKLLPLDSPAASGPAVSGPAASGPVVSGPAASGSPAAPATPAGATSAPSPRNITVVPGHGPCSDLATEGMTNPFLMPFNEPYED